MGRDIPDPVFVRLVAFLVFGSLKSSKFQFCLNAVLFSCFLSSLVRNVAYNVE